MKYSLVDELKHFRNANNEEDMLQAIALVSVLLLTPEERERFGSGDGATTLGDHLVRLCQEQAGAQFKWISTNAFGFKMEKASMFTWVQYVLIAITHASIDAAMTEQLCTLHIPQFLMNEFILQNPMDSAEENDDNDDGVKAKTLPISFPVLALEALRNLCYLNVDYALLSNGAMDSLWDILLTSSNGDTERRLSCDILCNITSHKPRSTHATRDHLSLLLSCLLNEDEHGQPFLTTVSMDLQMSIADLACNLARDTEYSIIFICTLEEHHPRSRSNKSSLGFLQQWAESTDNSGLKASLDSFVHNLAWSDVSTKICIQKLYVSSYLECFLNGMPSFGC